MDEIKKNLKNDDGLIQNTQGGEMPDPNRKVSEKASDAAEVFNHQEQRRDKPGQKDGIPLDQKKKAG